VIPIDEEQTEEPEGHMVDIQAIEEANNWAIVVYQAPVVYRPPLEIQTIAVPFGPSLPPEMIWRRSFENLLEAPTVFEVPKPLLLQPASPVVLSKRNWDLAFSQDGLPLLTWKEQEPVRPVARALFTEDMQQKSTAETVTCSALGKKGRRPRKTLAPTPLVETSVRRCTRSSVQRDGFKPTFQELAPQPKRKNPKAKPLTAEMLDDPAHADIPPATPVSHLQAIGQDLGIDAKLLTVDALMVDPLHAGNTTSNE
jgi:hypothetical protein